jgi:putative tributyrin esterase
VRRRLLLGKRLFTFLALGLVTIAATASSGSSHPLALDEQLQSRALAAPMHALVVLPNGYFEGHRHYPVVYFLHGLPATATSYTGDQWVGRALANVGPAILVLPQGARDGDTDGEYLDWGAGRDWETYVASELPKWIDAHFRTIPTRAGRAIVGLSAGGYGASMIGLNHLSEYSVIESWSGYFHPTNPAGTASIDGGPNSNVHQLLPVLAHSDLSHPTYFAFYVGTSDTRFRAENAQLNDELNKANLPHQFTVYPGGHEAALWEAHAEQWLRMALAHLAAPTGQ